MNEESNQGEIKQEPVEQTVNIELPAEVKKKTRPIIYTEEFVKNEVEKILEEAMENKELTVLGEIFENKAYSSQRFSEWAEKFKNNDEISESIKKIKDLFENRVNIGGLKGKLNPTMSIFNLKNNYGWKDKNETDITTNGRPIIQIVNQIAQKYETPPTPSEDSRG
jgi:DNA primase